MKTVQPRCYVQIVVNQHGESLMRIDSESRIPLMGELIVVDGYEMRIFAVVHRYDLERRVHNREIWVEELQT